jgi:hypothetical protein
MDVSFYTVRSRLSYTGNLAKLYRPSHASLWYRVMRSTSFLDPKITLTRS